MKMTIDMVRNFFLWCSIINVGLLLFSFVMFWVGREWIYRIHSKWFALSKEQFDMLWYAMLGFYKIIVFVFNIVPYIALCIIG